VLLAQVPQVESGKRGGIGPRSSPRNVVWRDMIEGRPGRSKSLTSCAVTRAFMEFTLSGSRTYALQTVRQIQDGIMAGVVLDALSVKGRNNCERGPRSGLSGCFVKVPAERANGAEQVIWLALAHKRS